MTMREGSVEVIGPGMKAPARVVGGQRLRANERDRRCSGRRAGGGGRGRDDDDRGPPRPASPRSPTRLSRRRRRPSSRRSRKRSEKTAPRADARCGSRGVRRGARSRRRRRSRCAGRRPMARARDERGKLQGSVRGRQCAKATVTRLRRSWRRGLVRLGDTARLAGDRRARRVWRIGRRGGGSASPTRRRLRPGQDRLRSAQGLRRRRATTSNVRETFPARAARRARPRVFCWSRGSKQVTMRAARDAADSYLRSFPNGPHATLARDIRRPLIRLPLAAALIVAGIDRRRCSAAPAVAQAEITGSGSVTAGARPTVAAAGRAAGGDGGRSAGRAPGRRAGGAGAGRVARQDRSDLADRGSRASRRCWAAPAAWSSPTGGGPSSGSPRRAPIASPCARSWRSRTARRWSRCCRCAPSNSCASASGLVGRAPSRRPSSCRLSPRSRWSATAAWRSG